MAYDLGNVYGLFNLGLIFENDKNYEEAKKYYLMAIKLGDLNSIVNLGILYDNEENYEEAKKYYLMAIKLGDSDAKKKSYAFNNKIRKIYIIQ